ncbi:MULTISPECIES: hypothetical protein [Vibrio]|uniref:Uncharacterized protein n=1 Tax=Vibrio halioticoli NBRC 102217 TaxID=1219072 RepID=V5F510_9VIBR|nr:MULTISPECIES: hypothetical protein [Vibrio]MPW35932.1 hypothetical protein [Vibrio sp. B1Z05]GAD90549.1 hypothetical protein VHA01S_047_00180 [Vibrio halioticoli NBRC 102217]
MNAKKALKKLKKKSQKKIKKQGIEQLKKLKLDASKVKASNEGQLYFSDALKQDINQGVNQVIADVAYELATPLLPVLSWFNDHQHNIDIVEAPLREQLKKPSSLKDATSSAKPISVESPRSSSKLQSRPAKSILHVALKSPPCKRCPALQNGICKCAAKRYKLSA